MVYAVKLIDMAGYTWWLGLDDYLDPTWYPYRNCRLEFLDKSQALCAMAETLEESEGRSVLVKCGP